MISYRIPSKLGRYIKNYRIIRNNSVTSNVFVSLVTLIFFHRPKPVIPLIFSSRTEISIWGNLIKVIHYLINKFIYIFVLLIYFNFFILFVHKLQTSFQLLK